MKFTVIDIKVLIPNGFGNQLAKWKIGQRFFEMASCQPALPSGVEEIDLREVFAALPFRWDWVVGSCFREFVLVVSARSLKLRSAS